MTRRKVINILQTSYPRYILFIPILILTVSGIAQEKQDSVNNWRYNIRYVSADKLNLRAGPTIDSRSLQIVDFGEKVVILSDQRVKQTPGWVKSVYPYNGYFSDEFLMPDRAMDSVYLKGQE